MFRDRRVLQGTVIMPVFMIALFVFLLGTVASSVKKGSSLVIAVVSGSDKSVLAGLQGDDAMQVVPVASMAEGKELLRQKTVRLVVLFPPNISEAVVNGDAVVEAAYNSEEPLSSVALGAIKDSINQANKAAVKAVYRAKGVPESMTEPLRVKAEDTARKEGLGGSGIVGLLPYLIVLWAFYGGMSIVSDLVAGEKERGTMETLLISPVKRAGVALGKILALSVVCLVSSLTTLVGLLLLAALRLEVTKELFPSGMQISALAVICAAGVLMSLVVFFAAMMVSLSAYSRNIRESQTYMGVMSFAILLPAVFSQFIGFTGVESAPWVKFTPVLNTALSLKDLLHNDFNPALIVGSIGVNTCLGLLFILVAFRLFRREEIVLRV